MRSTPLVAALAFALLSSAPSTDRAQAQSTPRPSITVAATISAEPASQAAFAISVGPPSALPHNSFVRVRGLPPTVALSDGHSIGPGAWAVSLAALPALKLTLPAEVAGRSEIVITLLAVDGAVLAEARSVLAIATARTPAKAEKPPDPPPAASILRAGTPLLAVPPVVQPPPQAAEKPLPPVDKARALQLVKKGDEQLELGSVETARLFYERAADIGYAQAAMALAGTYDAAELARLQVVGVVPDPKSAKRWYERARDLGAAGAEERLRQIGAK